MLVVMKLMQLKPSKLKVAKESPIRFMVTQGFGDVEVGAQLNFLELCAGSHRLADVALEFGLKSLAMDASCLDNCGDRGAKLRVRHVFRG